MNMFPMYILLLLLAVSSTIGTPQIVPLKNANRLEGGSILRAPGAFQTERDYFECPDFEGVYEDEFQCDKYWICKDGISVPRLCDDGLVFDTLKDASFGDPCDSPHVIDCSNRTELQEPSFHSEFCPRRHGLFSDPDYTICNVFYTCIKGQHVKTDCTIGLYFDEVTGTCTWTHLANRVGCIDIKPATKDGFTCPEEKVTNAEGMKIPHPSYPHLTDCQKFYVCLNGLTPQDASCNLGKVFSELRMLCDYPENVPECEGWYANDPRFADYYYDEATGPNKGADPGKADTIF